MWPNSTNRSQQEMVKVSPEELVPTTEVRMKLSDSGIRTRMMDSKMIKDACQLPKRVLWDSIQPL